MALCEEKCLYNFFKIMIHWVKKWRGLYELFLNKETWYYIYENIFWNKYYINIILFSLVFYVVVFFYSRLSISVWKWIVAFAMADCTKSRRKRVTTAIISKHSAVPNYYWWSACYQLLCRRLDFTPGCLWRCIGELLMLTPELHFIIKIK